MIAAICLDDNGGMRFNRRRQSRDRAMAADLLALCAPEPLWMAPESAALFEAPADRLRAVPEPLQGIAAGGWCFVERGPLGPWLDRLEKLVVYRWNRRYPADEWLDIPLLPPEWILEDRREFPGTSHETITREIYRRSN